MLLTRLCSTLVRDGALTLIDAHGTTHRFGAPSRPPDVVVRLHDRALHAKLPVNPHLYLGEAYMDGSLTVERGDIYDLLDLCARNLWRLTQHPMRASRARSAGPAASSSSTTRRAGRTATSPTTTTSRTSSTTTSSTGIASTRARSSPIRG